MGLSRDSKGEFPNPELTRHNVGESARPGDMRRDAIPTLEFAC